MNKTGMVMKMLCRALLLCCLLVPLAASAEVGRPVNISASTAVQNGHGRLLGIFVASAGGTMKVWDSGSATGTVLVNTFTPAAATYYPLPGEFQVGLFVTITGAVDCTVFVTP